MLGAHTLLLLDLIIVYVLEDSSDIFVPLQKVLGHGLQEMTLLPHPQLGGKLCSLGPHLLQIVIISYLQLHL